MIIAKKQGYNYESQVTNFLNQFSIEFMNYIIIGFSVLILVNFQITVYTERFMLL